MGVVIKLKFKEYGDGMSKKVDKAMAFMTYQVEKIATPKVPQKTSALMTSAFTTKIAEFQYRFGYNKEYAQFQEAGVRADGTHKVSNYSKAGTGAHFLKEASDLVENKKIEILKHFLGQA